MSELKNGTKSSKVDWKMVKLGEVCEVNQRTYSLSEEWSFINYLDTGSVTENHIQQIQYLDSQNDKIPSRARRKVIKDSILYSTVRPNQRHYAILREIPENFLVSTGFAVIDANPSLANAKFLYYVLTQDSVVDYFQITAEQSVSTYPSLNPSDIMGLTISLPPLAIQRKIVAVLGALDDKIENNRKICANLEAQAQALFKSWFVDFEPFGGEMPKDWKMGKLGEVAEITMGQSPDGKSLNENNEGVTFFQGRAEFGNRFPTKRLSTTEPKRMARKGDILLSVRAPVGDLNVALEDCCIGRGLAAIRSKGGFSSFLLSLLKSKKADFDLYEGAGTIFGSINKDSLHDLQVIIPSDNTMKDYERVISSADAVYHEKELESRALAEMRDALLPKLMSGEIDVSEVVV